MFRIHNSASARRFVRYHYQVSLVECQGDQFGLLDADGFAADPDRGHLLAQIEALGLLRLDTTLSEAVAYGEMGFLPALPATGQAAAEIAALVAELQALEWLPPPMSRTNM